MGMRPTARMPKLTRRSRVLITIAVAVVALLFFMHGAKLSREAVLAGLAHWRLHLLVVACTFALFPVLGLVLGPVLGALGIYFWVLRGVALAAFHGCPVWKGVVATLLHVVIAVACGCGLVFVAWQLALSMAAPAYG